MTPHRLKSYDQPSPSDFKVANNQTGGQMASQRQEAVVQSAKKESPRKPSPKKPSPVKKQSSPIKPAPVEVNKTESTQVKVGQKDKLAATQPELNGSHKQHIDVLSQTLVPLPCEYANLCKLFARFDINLQLLQKRKNF
jgi:hypothetical protein